MKTIKIFETFAGIGAQHKALSIIKKNNKDFFFKAFGTSEWDVWANISYNLMHNFENKDYILNKNESEIEFFLENFTHSFDSKKPVKPNFLNKQGLLFKEELITSLEKSKNQGSVTEINGKKLIDDIGEFNLLTYSFPCQDLSVAGSFHGFNQGMARGSGTRSGLLWEIERILKELNEINKLPKFLMLENVKNMISSRHKQDYIEWLEFLHNLGYNTQTYLLNALDYGIPQSRERVYAVSVLNAKNFRDTYSETNSIVEIDNKPKDVSKEYGISKKIEDILKVNYSNKIQKKEAISSTPNKTPSRKRMYNNNPVLFTTREEEVLKFKNKKYKKNKYGYYLNNSRTITTKQDRHPNAGVIYLTGTILENPKSSEKANYRFLTPRETFLLMGFEDSDYDRIIKNSIDIKKEILYRQAGNSIVVNVLVAIFDMLKDIK